MRERGGGGQLGRGGILKKLILTMIASKGWMELIQMEKKNIIDCRLDKNSASFLNTIINIH